MCGGRRIYGFFLWKMEYPDFDPYDVLPLYANLVYTHCMNPIVKLKALLVNVQVLKTSILYVDIHVLVSHGKL